MLNVNNDWLKFNSPSHVCARDVALAMIVITNDNDAVAHHPRMMGVAARF